MRHTKKAKAVITIACNGTTASQTVTLYQEVDGRWFYTVAKGGGKGVSVQYVKGTPQTGFWIELAGTDTGPQR